MTSDVQTVDTRFGTFEFQEGDVVTFPQGLPGFESCERFVLLSHDTLAPLRCLHAVDGTATFLAVDPHSIVSDYTPSLGREERARVDAEADTPLVWLALLTFNGDDAPTANLRAPVIVNPASMRGCQIIVDDERYTVRHHLVA